jgi:hypothetical protein
MYPMNAAQDALHEALEDEAGMNPDHPKWAISITKQVYDMIRDSIKVEDVPYLALSIFEKNLDSVGRSVWLGCIDELNDFAGDADLEDGHE